MTEPSDLTPADAALGALLRRAALDEAPPPAVRARAVALHSTGPVRAVAAAAGALLRRVVALAVPEEGGSPIAAAFGVRGGAAPGRQWLFRTDECEIDLRVGGKYRYEWEDKGRNRKMAMGGTFTAVIKPERIGAREKFDDDWTGGETEVAQVFTEKGGKTTLTLTVLYASKEARDGAAKSGMTEGMEAGYQRLDEVLAELG